MAVALISLTKLAAESRGLGLILNGSSHARLPAGLACLDQAHAARCSDIRWNWRCDYGQDAFGTRHSVLSVSKIVALKRPIGRADQFVWLGPRFRAQFGFEVITMTFASKHGG